MKQESPASKQREGGGSVQLIYTWALFRGPYLLLAVLVAQCAKEMFLFLDKLFPAERSRSDRKYVSDLLVTCYSSYSRNRRLGNLIGRGCTVRGLLYFTQSCATFRVSSTSA